MFFWYRDDSTNISDVRSMSGFCWYSYNYLKVPTLLTISSLYWIFRKFNFWNDLLCFRSNSFHTVFTHVPTHVLSLLLVLPSDWCGFRVVPLVAVRYQHVVRPRTLYLPGQESRPLRCPCSVYRNMISRHTLSLPVKDWLLNIFRPVCHFSSVWTVGFFDRTLFPPLKGDLLSFVTTLTLLLLNWVWATQTPRLTTAVVVVTNCTGPDDPSPARTVAVIWSLHDTPKWW